MKLRLLSCFTVLSILAAAIFGGMKRQSYTDITKDSRYLESIQTAEFPEALITDCCDKMMASLPDSQLILRVSVSEEIEYLFGTGRQKVRVQEVYAGNDLEIGDEIYLTSRHWCLGFGDSYHSLERGFINLMTADHEYLVFLSHRMDTLENETPPVYSMVDDFLIAPVFCYQTHSHVILVPADEESTAVPYQKVKDNEFFATSEFTLDVWKKLKSRLLSAYPRKESAG
ncbi:MAG: hypothetical protein LBQ15_03395 [Clostridium sp.]|jgi:hypothetical protein|nr:hypothetical protein [Clostridium sp.]